MDERELVAKLYACEGIADLDVLRPAVREFLETAPRDQRRRVENLLADRREIFLFREYRVPLPVAG